MILVCVYTQIIADHMRNPSVAPDIPNCSLTEDLVICGRVDKRKKRSVMWIQEKIFDAHSLSGRSPRIMQTDGDGVFTGGEFSKLLESEKIRHERSAPYDSDTNSFIERARHCV